MNERDYVPLTPDEQVKRRPLPVATLLSGTDRPGHWLDRVDVTSFRMARIGKRVLPCQK